MEPILSHPWYKESQLASCRVKTNNKSVSVYSKISDVNVFKEMPLKDDLKPNFLPDSNWKKKNKKKTAELHRVSLIRPQSPRTFSNEHKKKN